LTIISSPQFNSTIFTHVFLNFINLSELLFVLFVSIFNNDPLITVFSYYNPILHDSYLTASISPTINYYSSIQFVISINSPVKLSNEVRQQSQVFYSYFIELLVIHIYSQSNLQSIYRFSLPQERNLNKTSCYLQLSSKIAKSLKLTYLSCTTFLTFELFKAYFVFLAIWFINWTIFKL